MTKNVLSLWAILGLWLVSTADLEGEPLPYTDEAQFLLALSEQGYASIHEGFEDDMAWGAVRSTIVGGSRSAPNVTHLGITWTSSSPDNGVTTGEGPARAGRWGFYSLPHGDYADVIGDGFGGTGVEPLVAVGGWIQSNTPPAKVGLFLDGDFSTPIDFGAAGELTGGYRFFGIIDPAGFSRFDFRELEGTAEDQKLIFADDFTFAFGGSIRDCNENGVADPQDISDGTSTDCNGNLIPDECEIDTTSTAPGGPFFCSSGCDPDCNHNGLLDSCEVVSARSYSSGQLSPIGAGSPQSFTLASPPHSRADVIVNLTAYANLGGAPDHIALYLEGVLVGTVFGATGSDCPEGAPDSAGLVIPMEVFNDAVDSGEGSVVVELIASVEVSPDECDDPSYVTVDLVLFGPSDLDLDEDGVPDGCGIQFIRGDANGDQSVDISDAVLILLHLFLGAPASECEKSEDGDDNGILGVTDAVRILDYLFLSAPPLPAPNGVCGVDPTEDALLCESYAGCNGA